MEQTNEGSIDHGVISELQVLDELLNLSHEPLKRDSTSTRISWHVAHLDGRCVGGSNLAL